MVGGAHGDCEGMGIEVANEGMRIEVDGECIQITKNGEMPPPPPQVTG